MARGLAKQVMQIPLASGLNTKGDTRAASPPTLDACRDIQFDELGGLQTRKPFGAPMTNIFGGGTLSSCRRLFKNGTELLCFTDVALYSWDFQLSAWVLKGTHLATKIGETTPFATTGDQVDCDRAELNGTVVYAWTDGALVFVAAIDKTTGAVLMPPTAPGGASAKRRPRLVALSTKILLFANDYAVGSALIGWAIDPATPATGIAGAGTTVLNDPNFNLCYDATRQIGADTALVAARRITTTQYSLIKVTSGLAVTSSLKNRVCDGPIAVACDPTGVSVQVVRGHGTAIEGDMMTISSLADVNTGQAVGSALGTVNQIAAAYRSVQNSSVYRCYAFWSSSESASVPGFLCKYNWVSTSATLGTQATLSIDIGVASRAFDYNGSVYVWGVFALPANLVVSGGAPTTYGAVQNCYFMFRDDGTFHSKATMGLAGGFSASTGHLPGVALTSGTTGFSWCGGIRRTTAFAPVLYGYAQRAPRDITVTFDSNESRRTARLGQTLYITGGEILQYDGRQLTEVGFHLFPTSLNLLEVVAGSLANGSYSFKSTLHWINARGESERSAATLVGSITLVGGPSTISVSANPIHVTHKVDPTWGTNLPAFEFWRSVVNPPPGAPFYLATSSNPASTSNPDRYVANDPAAASVATLSSGIVDASISTLESSAPFDAALDDLAPPAATIILATQDRLFLAGVAGRPDQIWYSKQRADGSVAAFNDALVINLPQAGGDITALALLDGVLVVYRQTATYAVPGEGFDNTGAGQGFSPAILLSSDVGATSADSVAVTPMGHVFKSSKGWYLLDRQKNMQYIGAPVDAFDADTIVSVRVIESQHQIRCLSTSRMLVLDYFVHQWSEWGIADGLSATIWNGSYAYLSATGPKLELATFAGGVTYGLDVELPWIKLNDLQGFGRLYRMLVLGEYLSAFHLRVWVAYDYASDGAGGTSWTDVHYWTPTNTTVGAPLECEIRPSQQQCTAVKLRLTAVSTADDGSPPSVGASLKLTGLALEYGVRPDLNRRIAASQRTT